MAKQRQTVPKFGTWDKNNAGYTAYFDKVRQNKGATAPPLQHRPYNPNDPEDGPLRAVPAPSSRPSTAGGRPSREQAHHTHHRRAGSTSSEPGAERSKFAPPPQYYQRPNPQDLEYRHHGSGGHRHHHQSPGEHGGGGHRHHHPSPGDHGGGHHRGTHAPRQQHHQHHHAAPAPAPRVRSPSPQNNNTPQGRQRPSAVPRFGVWDEQSAAAAAQGFTVQFERVKRDREVARAGGGMPEVPRPPPPPPQQRSHRDSPFFAKMFMCFHPTDKYRY